MSERAQPIIVQPACSSEREELAALLEEDLRALRIEHPRERTLRAIDMVLADEGDRTLFWTARLEPEGPVVGLLFANVTYSVKHGGRSLWLEQLYVRPEARQHGVGRALVERSVQWARDSSLAGIDLESYQLNAPASILYRSLGFRRLGRERFSFRLEDGDA